MGKFSGLNVIKQTKNVIKQTKNVIELETLSLLSLWTLEESPCPGRFSHRTRTPLPSPRGPEWEDSEVRWTVSGRESSRNIKFLSETRFTETLIIESVGPLYQKRRVVMFWSRAYSLKTKESKVHFFCKDKKTRIRAVIPTLYLS